MNHHHIKNNITNNNKVNNNIIWGHTLPKQPNKFICINPSVNPSNVILNIKGASRRTPYAPSLFARYRRDPKKDRNINIIIPPFNMFFGVLYRPKPITTKATKPIIIYANFIYTHTGQLYTL